MYSFFKASKSTMQSYDGQRIIDILYDRNDPLVWIVRSSKKFLWFRMNSSVISFQDEQQALQYAREKA